MSYQLTITVTKEILERSKNCGFGEMENVSTNCAVALAVRDIFPKAIVTACAFYPYLHLPHQQENCIILDRKTIDYIRKFDSTPVIFRPGLPEYSFTLNIPDSIIDQINIDEIKPLLINHPTLKLQEA